MPPELVTSFPPDESFRARDQAIVDDVLKVS
jgi:hypothetical protein